MPLFAFVLWSPACFRKEFSDTHFLKERRVRRDGNQRFSDQHVNNTERREDRKEGAKE